MEEEYENTCNDPIANDKGVGSPAMGYITKPPIGITPRWIGDVGRGIEILNGCVRYIEKRKKIPNDWIQELIGINRRMKK